MITFSSPAKVHLIGEHTVVYGKPALLAAINLRAKVSISSSKNHPVSDKSLSTLKSIVEKTLKDYFGIKKLPKYNLTLNSQIPIGSNLGSSAACASACIAALLTFLGYKWNLDIINNLTYETEKFFNGNPSGGDNTTVVRGGWLWFRKESANLKLMSPLPFKPHYSKFFLINSGKPKETTREMVEFVAKRFQDSKKQLNQILNLQEELAKQMLAALNDPDDSLLIETIKSSQRNVEKLNVVGQKAKGIIKSVEKIGGVAKINGAGGRKSGSGMLLASHQDHQILLDLANRNHWEIIPIKLGMQGLKKES